METEIITEFGTSGSLGGRAWVARRKGLMFEPACCIMW